MYKNKENHDDRRRTTGKGIEMKIWPWILIYLPFASAFHSSLLQYELNIERESGCVLLICNEWKIKVREKNPLERKKFTVLSISTALHPCIDIHTWKKMWKNLKRLHGIRDGKHFWFSTQFLWITLVLLLLS